MANLFNLKLKISPPSLKNKRFLTLNKYFEFIKQNLSLKFIIHNEVFQLCVLFLIKKFLSDWCNQVINLNAILDITPTEHLCILVPAPLWYLICTDLVQW